VVLIVLALAVFGAFTIIQSLTKETIPAEIIQPTQQQNNGISPTQIAVIPSNTEVISTNIAVIPTVTPTLQPAAISKSSVLFEDNFDTGLSPLWETISGEPMIANGMLTAAHDTWLLVGDPSWKNYSVEYDVEIDNQYFSYGFDVIAVRVVDIDNMYAYKWAEFEAQWNIVQNNKWNVIPKSDEAIPSFIHLYNFRITANKNIITLYIDGEQKFSFVDSKFPQGRVGLLISENTVIDNFKVKEILG